jgi:splicing factor 3B subunit 3
MIVQTEIDDVPLAVMAFQGRVVAGVGKALRIYEMGKKRLLRKVENKVCMCHIISATCVSHFILTDFRIGHHDTQHARVTNHRR